MGFIMFQFTWFRLFELYCLLQFIGIHTIRKQRGEKVFCDNCENKQWTSLELWRVKEHLKGNKEDGTDVLGIYPLLPDGTCRFIVFDFDNHEKGSEDSDYANTRYDKSIIYLLRQYT